MPIQPEPVASAELRQALDKLKAEREALARQRQAIGVDLAPNTSRIEEMTLLRLKIAELIGRLGERGKSEPSRQVELSPEKHPDQEPSRTKFTPITAASTAVEPVDKLTLAQTLFQAGEGDAALRELRLIDAGHLSGKEKAWWQFLTAGCLRKQGRLAEAAVLYREVAESKEEDFLTESALWHLGFIRWRQEIQKQLDDSRRRREAR
jgi:hypothetical protein